MNNIKTMVSRTIYQTGTLLGVEKPQSVVLCYHSIDHNDELLTVTPAHFIEQVRAIQQHSVIVSLDELINTKSTKHRVALTIDDGYADIKNILPFIIENNIPVTLFIMENPKSANKKNIGNNLPLLSDKELMKLATQKNITIGCHSATHANLVSLEKKELLHEIIVSKNILEKKLGKKVMYFSYPNGAYNQEVIDAVKTAGYMAAFTVEPGNGTAKPFEIPRIVINRNHTAEEFPAVYSRSIQMIRKLIAL